MIYERHQKKNKNIYLLKDLLMVHDYEQYIFHVNLSNWDELEKLQFLMQQLRSFKLHR